MKKNALDLILIFCACAFFTSCTPDNSQVIQKENKELHLKNSELNQKVKTLESNANSMLSELEKFRDLNNKYVETQQKFKSAKDHVGHLELTIAKLEQEISVLKETDQHYFNRAVDLYNAANGLNGYEAAQAAFDKLLQKFPTTSYSAKANEYKADLQKKIDKEKAVATAKQEVDKLFSEKRWDDAKAKLESVKNILGEKEFQQLHQKIDEEQNKPEKYSVNQLVFWGEKLGYRFTLATGQITKRVEIAGYLGGDIFIDRKNSNFTMYNGFSGYTTQGESISVYYDKTDLADFFLNNVFKEKQSVKVIGTVRSYSNSSDIYIRAEKITLSPVKR